MSHRESGEGNITPLPDLTCQVPAPHDPISDSQENELSGKLPELLESWGAGMPQVGNTIDIGLSG